MPTTDPSRPTARDGSTAPAGRSVVISGASTGIGEACALRLDRLGYRVFAGVRRPEDAAALRAKASARLMPLFLDVTDPASVSAACQEVAGALGAGALGADAAAAAGLDGLVNNAGIAVAGPLEFIPLDSMRRQFEVNVLGVLAVTQAFIPLLRPAHGRIINISSLAGYMALPFMGPYAASKHAVEALSDALRLELRRWGMGVVLIEPGDIATPIWLKSLAAADEMLGQMPPPVTQLYGPLIDFTREHARAVKGIPADEVARVVEQALTARAPHARYRVGTDAHLMRLISRAPDKLRDWLVARALPQG